MNWSGILVSWSGWFISSGAFLFLFREKIKAMLKRSVEEELARVTHELDVKKEIIKNDLSREAYKAELMLNNVHAIYPELASKLERAFGAVNGLQGLKFSVNYKQLEVEELKRFVLSRKFPQLQEEKLLKAIDRDKESSLNEIEESLKAKELEDARLVCVDANNYRIIKAIYCSDEVLGTFQKCYESIWSAWADISVGSQEPRLWMKGSETIRKETPDKMDAFRTAIRSELRIDLKK